MGAAVLTHAIRVLLDQRAELAVERDLDVKVEVAVVARVRLHAEDAVDLLVALHRQVVVKVKHRLLPVCVRRVGRRAEAHPLVALGELDREERHQRVHIVVATQLQCQQVRYSSKPIVD